MTKIKRSLQPRTQDIPAMPAHEFYELDPEYVTQPGAPMRMTRAAFWSLLSLRAYLFLMLALGAYRFMQLAHWMK